LFLLLLLSIGGTRGDKEDVDYVGDGAGERRGWGCDDQSGGRDDFFFEWGQRED